MSDETAPQATEDTPELETAPPQETTDWQKRYEDLQPEYTKKSQILSNQEALLAHISENFPELMAEETPADEDEYEDYEDTPEPQPAKPDPRIDQFEAWMAEQQYEKDLTRFVGDRELDDEGREIVEAYSRANGHNVQSLEKAVNKWFALADKFQPAEVDAPKGRKAPVPPPAAGAVATGVPDYSEMTEDQAVQAMTARARALDPGSQR